MKALRLLFMSFSFRSWGVGARERRRGRGAAPSLRSDGDDLRVGPDEDRLRDLADLVGGHADALGVLADLLRAGGLVDADRAQRAVRLGDHVRADPADVVG